MKKLTVFLFATCVLVGNAFAQLGSAASDLVFTPITPCRIVDTRNAGGALAANATRSFNVTNVANYTSQGGVATNCGGAGAAGTFASALLNVTAVSTTAGYLTIFPAGTARPLAAALNFGANDVQGNSSVFRLDQSGGANDLSIFSTGQTHLIIDILGYFLPPAPTALQCVNTPFQVTVVAPGTNANAVAPTCAAGYTPTETNCETSSWLMPLVFASSGECSARNNDAASQNLRASRTCCRVPGR